MSNISKQKNEPEYLVDSGKEIAIVSNVKEHDLHRRYCPQQ